MHTDVVLSATTSLAWALTGLADALGPVLAHMEAHRAVTGAPGRSPEVLAALLTGTLAPLVDARPAEAAIAAEVLAAAAAIVEAELLLVPLPETPALPPARSWDGVLPSGG